MYSASTRKLPQISDFSADEVTPAVLMLLEFCHFQQEQIQALRDEIARLKGQKPKPNIKPSKLESGEKGKQKQKGKRSRQGKRKKTRALAIHEVVCIAPEAVPEGSRFKGYEDFTVQDIRIDGHNTRYRMERWDIPDGGRLVGKLPREVGEAHFGPTLRAFILYQYHHAHVTQPLILEQLREWGIDISAGQISAILTMGLAEFHAEKEALLRVGLKYADYVHVDDTGARHRGQNGYCTHIGNELFAYFASTDSKSRINFLALLRAGRDEYTLNNDALAYMEAQNLPEEPLNRLASRPQKILSGVNAWLGSGLGNDVLVGCRRRGEHLLGEAVEEQATSTRASTIEAESELLKVRLQMLRVDRTLVGPEKPAFKQTGHPMNGWHRHMGWGVTGRQDELRTAVAVRGQRVVAIVPIGANKRSRFGDGADKRNQAGSLDVGNMAHPHTAETLWLVEFHGDDHNELPLCAPAPFAAHRGPSDVGFINLHLAGKPVAVWPDHCPAELVKHRPRSLLALESQHALQTQRTDAKLLIGEVPSSGKPRREGHPRLVQDRARRDRRPATAPRAHPEVLSGTPCLNRPARRTYETFWPAEA